MSWQSKVLQLERPRGDDLRLAVKRGLRRLAKRRSGAECARCAAEACEERELAIELRRIADEIDEPVVDRMYFGAGKRPGNLRSRRRLEREKKRLTRAAAARASLEARSLARRALFPAIAWRSCGIAGMEQPDGAKTLCIVELTTSLALLEEGEAMHHCVARYWRRAQSGECAIYSMRLLAEGSPIRREVTLEVLPATRRLVQARGRFNRAINERELAALEHWAKLADLSLSLDEPRTA